MFASIDILSTAPPLQLPVAACNLTIRLQCSTLSSRNQNLRVDTLRSPFLKNINRWRQMLLSSSSSPPSIVALFSLVFPPSSRAATRPAAIGHYLRKVKSHLSSVAQRFWESAPRVYPSALEKSFLMAINSAMVFKINPSKCPPPTFSNLLRIPEVLAASPGG